MNEDDLLSEDTLLPGDVVVDEATHRPMQVTGYDLRGAESVPEVWESDVNRHSYDIDPDADVMELVKLPMGDRYFVPDSPIKFPAVRLKRVIPEPATGDRRVQQKVVRSILSHLLADARWNAPDGFAAEFTTLLRRNFEDEFVGEVEDFSEREDPIMGGGDG